MKHAHEFRLFLQPIKPHGNSSLLGLRVDEWQKPIDIQTNEQGPV